MNQPSAFQRTMELYDRYELQPDFFTELIDHLETGIVISRPSLFAMGKAVLLDDGRPAALIAAAVGDFGELLDHIPRSLPWIAFRRRGKNTLRVYPMERFCRLSAFGLHLRSTIC